MQLLYQLFHSKTSVRLEDLLGLGVGVRVGLYLIISKSIIEKDKVAGLIKISTFALLEEIAFYDSVLGSSFERDAFLPELVAERVWIVEEGANNGRRWISLHVRR